MTLARAAGLLAAAAVALGAPAAAHASKTQDSTFQDDNHLVYAAPAQVAATLDELRALGVDRVRVSLFWRLVAPSPDQGLRPNFDDTNPAQYPPGAWDRYDTIVRDAAQRGIGVIFDVTGPAPDWATGTSPDRPDIKATYDPNPLYFDSFLRAAGTRYSGTFDPGGGGGPLPRVSTWGIWNEPNQAGWLTPQWAPGAGGRMLPASPRIYRSLVDAAWDGLNASGHGADTILIGETAPKGLLKLTGETRSIDPVIFIEGLYCLDPHLQLYTGQAAADRGCPQSDQVNEFVAQHPALFNASGWAHHPYELIFSPSTPPRHRDRWITTGNLGSLTRLLRRIRARYRQPVRRIPLWLTEFGYQTPPDPLGVSLPTQAVYLDQAEYIAWRNPNVATLTQFLLYDDGPPYGLTFQSGLRTQSGAEKPAYAAYRLPLWLPRPRVRRGGRMEVWGLVRPAPNGTPVRVAIDVRRRGSRRWRPLTQRMASAARNYVDTRVRVRLPRGRWMLRLRWQGIASRSAPFTVR